jgi:hypothetical protein
VLLNQRDNGRFSPLVSACAKNSLEIVKAIFAAVKEMIPEEKDRAELLMRLLTATNKEGFTPLINACAKGSRDIVKAIFAAVEKMIPEDRREKFFRAILRGETVRGWDVKKNLNQKPELKEIFREEMIRLELGWLFNEEINGVKKRPFEDENIEGSFKRPRVSEKSDHGSRRGDSGMERSSDGRNKQQPDKFMESRAGSAQSASYDGGRASVSEESRGDRRRKESSSDRYNEQPHDKFRVRGAEKAQGRETQSSRETQSKGGPRR